MDATHGLRIFTHSTQDPRQYHETRHCQILKNNYFSLFINIFVTRSTLTYKPETEPLNNVTVNQ